MPRRTILIWSLLMFLGGDASAQHKGPSGNVVSQRDPATYIASSAAKVVFLISFQGDEAHARASGVILSPDGYIGTNYHALQGADTLEIRYFADPTNSDDYQVFGAAKLLYADAERDIAILKVNTTALHFSTVPQEQLA